MEQLDKHTIKSASFVLAGGACLLAILVQLFSQDGIVTIRGIRLLNGLVTPVMCFWLGMLIRWKVRKPNSWILGIAGALMFLSYFYGSYAIANYSWIDIFYQWWGLILLGFILPWDYLYDRRDPEGIKSGIVLLLSALVFCTIDLVNERMRIVAMPTPLDDLGALLATVTLNVLPFVTILVVYFAAEFSFSKAGQWLGSRKWFRIICWIAAAILFIHIAISLPGMHRDILAWRLTQYAVLPITVYLIIVICRIIRKLSKKDKTWKEVFAI